MANYFSETQLPRKEVPGSRTVVWTVSAQLPRSQASSPKAVGPKRSAKVLSPHTKHARKVGGGSIPARHGTRCEAHYVYNYFLSCRPFGYVFRAHLQL